MVSAPLAMTRSVSLAIALIELRTSAIASRPTSGTIIGGCGAMPAKTTELVWAITQPQWPWRISEGNLIINEQSDSSTDAIVSEARALARATVVLWDGRIPYEGSCGSFYHECS